MQCRWRVGVARLKSCFEMSDDHLPVRAFLTRADAANASRMLEAGGIHGKVTADLGGDLPFMLLVAPEHHERAIEILRRDDPPTPLCERCKMNPATMHLTMIVDGCSTTANFCQACFQLPRQ